MAFGINKSRPSPIAIDFGADTLKVLQIVPGDPPELVALGSATLPEEARVDFASRIGFLKDALPAVLRQHTFRGKRVMLSIPAFHTLIHTLEIPKSEPGDMDNLVQIAMQERLGIEPSRMVVRNYRAAEVVRDGVTRQEVVTLAASRDMVMRYLDLATRTKLEVAGMHSEPPCILRAFRRSVSPLDPDGPAPAIAYLDIGAATSKLVIAHGSKIKLAKLIHAGGDQWVRSLAEQKDMEFAEARLARVAEASGDDSNSSATATLTATAKASETCETRACLLDEVRLAFRHHASRYPQQPITRLIFMGGESARRSLCREIAMGVKTPAQLGDPFARIQRENAEPVAGLDLSQPQPGWAVPLGLCLSSANL
jgi:Tfp pilus assembly PilM family ATPase